MKIFYRAVVLVAICVATVTMSFAEDKQTPGAKTESMTGLLNKAPEVSFCMDGAAHVLLTTQNGSTNTVRLKGNADVKKQLDALLNETVTVTGKKNAGVECKAFEVLSVEKAKPAKN